MWKISRNIIFPRWSRKQQQKYVENSKPSMLCKTVSSLSGKKNYSDERYKKKQFNKEQGFFNCENIKFILFKTSILEKASVLGTITILGLNFHFKHLQYGYDYGRGRTNCPFSRNVFAISQEIPSPKIQNKNDSIYCKNAEESVQKQQSADGGTEKSQELEDAFEQFKTSSIQYSAAAYNHSGGSNLKINKKKAFRQFQRAARLGSVKALYNLGLCYERGEGTQKNFTRAAFCYRKAAMNGHGLASYNLAVFFLKGLGGLPVDPEIAKQLFAQAAEKNVPEAQLYIGLDCLEHKKYTEAFEIFKKLSKSNVLDGKYYLGVCYENGWGIEKNELLAAEIFSQAAISGHSKSVLKLSKFYEEGIGGCDFDLELSTALCQLLTNQQDKEWQTTFLRLNLKKNIIQSKRSFKAFLPNQKINKGIHTSLSVPEFNSYYYKPKVFDNPFIAQSHLDLSAPLLLKIDNCYSRKNMFYVGNKISLT